MIGSTPNIRKALPNEYRLMSHPVASENNIPPNPEPILAIPHTEAVTSPGKTSAGSTSRFASAPEYPNVAIETRLIASAGLVAQGMSSADVISAEKQTTLIRLAPGRDTFHLFQRTANNPPPARFPIAAVKKGIQAVSPIWRIVK